MNIRNTILGSLGALALGLTSPEYARADECECSLNDNNYLDEVLEYDGAVLVLFYGQTDTSARSKKVFDSLTEEFEDSRVNSLPIKFCEYDFRDNRAAVVAKMIGAEGVGIFMYRAGEFKTLKEKELDYLRGGPAKDEGIKGFVSNTGWWIKYDLLGERQPGDEEENTILLYKGTAEINEYPNSEIRR